MIEEILHAKPNSVYFLSVSMRRDMWAFEGKVRGAFFRT